MKEIKTELNMTNYKFSVDDNSFIKHMSDPQIDILKINSHFLSFFIYYTNYF